MYTDDKTAQIVLALLKKFNIRKIVVSPGTTNVPIARSVQFDPYFEVYSMVDERGAAYFAGGLAFASGEPVVISCTGATASRDYLPGLTEAFYRHLPVIALTSQHHSSTYQDLVPQMTDRTVSQNDVKRFSAQLPYVKDSTDAKKCERLVNEALLRATTQGGGPVHINMPVDIAYTFNTPVLPEVQKIDLYESADIPADALFEEIKDSRIGIFIGSHKPFSQKVTDAINRFVKAFDAVVLHDHTSCYQGNNGALITHAALLLDNDDLPDLIIDLGSVCGDYHGGRLYKGKKTWRVSEDGVIHNRFDSVDLCAVFHCSEYEFFDTMSQYSNHMRYYQTIRSKLVVDHTPRLPFSNIYACSKLSQMIPKGSYLHLAILNSLRSMDFFTLDKSITVSSNVGGFGIDGALSTTLGKSVANKSALTFAVVGDLAFFYDMNAIGNRHVHNRLRILVVNNHRGMEFRLNKTLESQWGSDTDDLIAAKGHFGSVRGWVESMGFYYMTANNATSFDAQIESFCDPDVDHFDRPVVFEIFTCVENEKQALQNMRNYITPIRIN